MKENSKYVKSRTEHSARNTVVAITARILAILSGFFVRVIFTHTLSQEYVGINGLFTDIISILALSELGIGTAITFALYKPIAEENIEKQKSIMKLYRQFYYIVALIVLMAGLALIPFMDYLIKDHQNIDHLILIYMMYLISSVLSYFMIYKKTLIDAHQLGYIGVLYHTIFLLIQYAGQAIILILTKNFILYLVLFIICTLGNNIMISLKADRLYPYLKEKAVAKLDEDERKKIYENIRAMLLHKIGNILVNNTDNLLLSSLIGSIVVGCYSNYFLIIGSVKQVMEQIFQGIAASVGNLGVTEEKGRIKKIFLSTFFLGQWVYGMISVAMFEALDFFVGKSFGADYVFSRNITLILCINFYLLGLRQATIVFRDSMGLFKYDKYKAIAEAAINLVVSICLGRIYGTIGIFLGTLISMALTSLWIEPYILYKYKIKESSISYFAKLFLYIVVTGALWVLEDYICGLLPKESWIMWGVKIIVCLFISNAVYYIIYCRTKEFILLKEKIISLINKKINTETTELQLNNEEKDLLLLIKNSIAPKEASYKLKGDSSKMLNIAKSHNVIALICEECLSQDIQVEIKEEILEDIKKQTEITTLQNYRLLLLTKNVCQRLTEHNINIAVLKGASAGYFYKEPELRKSGDVDILLLNASDAEMATDILLKCGCRIKEEQESNHHIAVETTEGIDIELHIMLTEPFDNKFINEYIEYVVQECTDKIEYKNIMGVNIPTLSDAYNAYELILHMLQHFLRAGFGLKLLCDWVVFWNREVEDSEKETYLRLVNESGIKGFSDIVTLTCCHYLGLKQDNVEWMELQDMDYEAFIREILDAEEFGKSDKNRMVALRGNTLTDYVREFHHQMHLNFPKAGKVFIAWPILWLITFVRFVNNNKKIRNTSFWSVMSEAGHRGRLTKDMKLFETYK